MKSENSLGKIKKDLPWKMETERSIDPNSPLTKLLKRGKVVVMLRDGKIFRVLSSHPIDLEVLDFDGETKGNLEYLTELETTLPNQINT